jgi:hypothetical protein
MKNMIKNTLVLIILALGFSGAANASIYCHTPRDTKVFQIHKQKVTFMVEGFSNRIPASINSVRTRKTIKGFTKVVAFEGHKHTIHIENANHFSEVDDYLIIRSHKGHEVTYPITCSNK